MSVNRYISGLSHYFTSLLLLLGACAVEAQSVPADLLELSIEELFNAEISERPTNDNGQSPAWHLQLIYQNSLFEDYYKGSDRLSVDEVLFVPGTEQRTDDNFPVVPTKIRQEVYAFVMAYDVSDTASLTMALPYVRQSTDHVSVVPGYAAFAIDSDGIGDVSLIGRYRFSNDESGFWQVGAGISLPTGSINQKGDTPRAAGNQQLPYSMQLGSGTFDVPFNINYLRRATKINWGSELVGKIRLGKNDRDYRLGNFFMVSSWLSLNTLEWVQPSIRVSYKYWDRIHGLDTELLVPGPFPFPAPVTNPRLFGGRQADIALGFKFPVFKSGQYVEVEFGTPFYQSLNGPQSGEEYHFALTYSVGF